MIPAFESLYHPLTSRPFLRDESYTEYAPCPALRPYIACFWSMEGSGRGGDVRVIPDTCIDIIIEVNHSRQSIKTRLCGLQDFSVLIPHRMTGDEVTSFAVRFHFWAARLFLDLDLRDLYNQVWDLELVQSGFTAGFGIFFYYRSVGERIAWMERFLLGKLNPDQYDPNLYNAVEYILKTKGNAAVKELCGYTCVGQRQMERLFQRDIGISMKRTASLVRYQNVWREIVDQKEFQVQDAVYRYGYSDQSHLLNAFRRFHGVWPDQAKQAALKWV